MKPTEAAISPPRDRLIDLPWFKVSSWASSSPFASTRSANRDSTRSRAAGVRPDQRPSSNARRALATARSTVAASLSSTSPIICSVAGSCTARPGPVPAFTAWPSMNAPWPRRAKARTWGRKGSETAPSMTNSREAGMWSGPFGPRPASAMTIRDQIPPNRTATPPWPELNVFCRPRAGRPATGRAFEGDPLGGRAARPDGQWRRGRRLGAEKGRLRVGQAPNCAGLSQDTSPLRRRICWWQRVLWPLTTTGAIPDIRARPAR